MSDADDMLARADLVRFLAASFYQPGPEFSEEGLFESMHACAALIDTDLARDCAALGAAFAAEPEEALLIDYTRLFLGPVEALALPYASVWLTREKTLYQDETAAVLAMYEAAGFEVDEGFRDLPDHVAAELEFLYRLLHRAYVAAAGQDAAAQDEARAQAREFVQQHLGRWLPGFLDAIERNAGTAFYRQLARVARAVLPRCKGAV